MTPTTTPTQTMPLPNSSLTEPEREVARLFLTQSTGGLKGAIRGLTERQWTFRPGPQSWSISQIADHVLMVSERVAGPMRQMLAQAGPAPESHDRKLIDELVMARFPSRLIKSEAPPFMLPTGRFVTPGDALAALGQIHSGTLDFLENTPDLRGRALDSPPLRAATQGEYQMMDGYQWLLALAAHTERHTKQILEVRAHQEFPEP